MNLYAILCRFIQGFLNTSASYYPAEHFDAQEYENTNCFLPSRQPLFTAQALSDFQKELSENIFYEIHDLLGIHLIFFRFQEGLVAAGPFVTKSWSDATAKNILLLQNIPASYFQAYKSYYLGFPCLRHSDVINTLSLALTSVTPYAPAYALRQLHSAPSRQTTESRIPVKEEFDNGLLSQRHKLERQLQESIREGRPSDAVSALGKLNNLPSLEFKRNDLQMPLIHAAAIRTLARMAAEDAGLALSSIHFIIRDAMQAFRPSQSQTEQHKLLLSMVYQLETAVREHKRQGYSLPVCNLLEHMQLHYDEELTLSELASHCNLSASHLARIFKEETGHTIFQELSKIRCEKAAGLLAATRFSIAEISASVGYLDNGYFVKVFKNQYGMTPSAYRKRTDARHS